MPVDRDFTVNANQAFTSFLKSENLLDNEAYAFDLNQVGSSLVWIDSTADEVPTKVEQGFYLDNNVIKSIKAEEDTAACEISAAENFIKEI